MKSKTEQKFLTELKQSKDHLYPLSFMYKPPDMPMFDKSRFIPEKPFDLFYFNCGIFIALEAKVHKVHTAWPLSKVRKHQTENLKICKNNGMLAYIVVNVRYGLGKNRINFASIIDVDDFIDLNKTVKSIKVIDLVKFNRMDWIKKNNKLVWDLEKLHV